MKLAGTIQINAIALPLDQMARRYEVLRSSCGVGDQPFQRIVPADTGLPLKEIGRELMIDGTLAGPTLEETTGSGRPGSRSLICRRSLRLTMEHCALLITMHQMSSYEPPGEAVTRQLCELYAVSPKCRLRLGRITERQLSRSPYTCHYPRSRAAIVRAGPARLSRMLMLVARNSRLYLPCVRRSGTRSRPAVDFELTGRKPTAGKHPGRNSCV